MKKLLFTFCGLLFFTIQAQEAMTATQWQEDLRFLQNTIHEEYPFLFVKTTTEDFDAAVDTLYQRIPNLEAHEIIVGMSRIIASFKYGHTGISFSQEPYTFRQLPMNLYAYKDGIFVQGVHKDYPEALGAEVLEVNEVPIAEALEAISPAVNAENDQYFKAYGINYLRIPEVLHAQGVTTQLEDSVAFTLVKDGKKFTQTFRALPKGEKVPTHYSHVFEDENWLEARDQSGTPLYLMDLEKIYFFEYLPEQKAVYVRHSQIQDEPGERTPEFYARLFDFIENNEVERLVLDVRLNGGGNNYKNKPVVTGLIKSDKINKIGSLYVIIGRRTFSACQNLVNELDNYTNVIFVGEPTAENVNFYGDNRPHALPNSKIPVFLSFAWWQDKPAWENAEWIAPHVPVEMSFAEYTSNQDPVLEAALSFSGSDFKRDPMEYIRNAYTAGRMDELAVELPKMIQDPRYGFFDFEKELNDSGRQMLNSGRQEQLGAAVQVFSFIAQMFPESANTWKNLGESYLTVGDKAKAIEFFEKAIALDPGGDAGKSAREMLDAIK